MSQCVSCGEKIEVYGNHHCTPEAEKRRQAREKQADQDYVNRKPCSS